MNQQEKERRLLNVDQVASKLGIGRSTVFLFSKLGRIPAQVKLGGASRWIEEELDRWIEQQPRGAYGEGGRD